MQVHSKQRLRVTAAVFGASIAFGLAACSSDNISSGAPLTPDQQNARIAASIKTDTAIFGALHASDVAEINAARAALQSASDTGVKAFATKMIADHTMLDSQATALATSLQIAPALPDSLLPNLILADSTTLANTTAGTTFDQVYVQQQVLSHVRTLAIIDASLNVVKNSTLQTMLQNTIRPVIQMHLQMAQDLQARIGTPPGTTSGSISH